MGLVQSAIRASTSQVKPLTTVYIAVSWRGSQSDVSDASQVRFLSDTVIWMGQQTPRKGERKLMFVHIRDLVFSYI